MVLVEEFIISFFISALLLAMFTKWQRRTNIGQHIRPEGPQLHNYKEGTPTMGGMVFVSVAIAVALFFDKSIINVFLALSTFAFFLIGYIDGVLKVIKKASEGFKSYQKLALQFLVAIIVYVISQKLNPHCEVSIPFSGRLDLGWFYPVFAVIFLIGMSNSSNLTDGLDGLAAGVYAIGAAGLLFLSTMDGLPLAMTISTLGGVLAFLFFNVKPAKIFMGDVGSLALGGYLGTMGILYGYEMWIAMLFPIFIFEVVTDLIQIIAIRKFKRRIFKMAPIHHHYELKGFSEQKVTFSFWLIDLIIVSGSVGFLCVFH